MKLEVGMYVRTNKGTIDKLDDKNIMMYQVALMGFGEKPIKASHNIIDLIERFDLVNGHLVICKMYENEKDIPTIVKCVGDYYFEEKDIKSIVTKEQFEGMQYVIK